ncbi:hypothetical protein OJ253_335 [Cryptosporidium canis]|uniref:Uncharacterized protein n=1 Tax=Cryptosporidium canis TaxID=195482 RepID=A0A9D5DIZ0_9CRYT|nr:hypothetical protein OJ253_335 [Cryptosporidium canis]
MYGNEVVHISAENLQNNDGLINNGSLGCLNIEGAISNDTQGDKEIVPDPISALEAEFLVQDHGLEIGNIKGEDMLHGDPTDMLFANESEMKQDNPYEIKEPIALDGAYVHGVSNTNQVLPITGNQLIIGGSIPLNAEEHSGTIQTSESPLPYKLWIDAKNRDWILEWRTKNGRWSVRKFSCKRWGKGKAYSHAINFLASLSSCGVIRGPNYSQRLLEPGDTIINAVRTNKTIDDELVLQLISQRETMANANKHQNDFESNNGLNTLAAIATAAAAIVSNPSKNQTRNHASQSTTTSPTTRGAVRKSGVPGVYWSQKPQGWRVVYYTGKDREFEYFKVPANASEEIIGEILEVAKRFRSQITSEGRHLPNGVVGSGTKRARLAEKKAAAAAAAAPPSAPEGSSQVLPSRATHLTEEGIAEYLKNASDIASKNLLDTDTLSQISSKLSHGNVAGTQNPNGAVPPGSYEWMYNPLLMSLYGNYSAAVQWAMFQNALSQNGGMLSSAVSGQTENSNSQPNPILNAFLNNPFINPFGLQMQQLLGQNAGVLNQFHQAPNANPSSQVNMNLLGRFLGVTFSHGQSNKSSAASPVGKNGNSAQPNPPNKDSTDCSNQLIINQQLTPNSDKTTQESANIDTVSVAVPRVDDDQPIQTETVDTQNENQPEVSSSSSDTPE